MMDNMQSSFGTYLPTGVDLDPYPDFSVVLAYEDFASGRQAKHAYDFLVEHLSSEYTLANQMWKFDVLGIPKLREIAAMDALTADIIVISCRGGSDLPPHVKSWVDSWSQSRGNAVGLVGLFACSAEQSRPIRKFLEEVATKCEMEFLAQADETTGEGELRRVLLSSGHTGQLEARRAVSTIADAGRQRFVPPQWGFDE